MLRGKHTLIHCVIFATCLTTCLMLFSLENTQGSGGRPRAKKPNALYPRPVQLFDLRFEYVLNNQVCEPHVNITAVLIVTSYYGHVEVRSAMRRAFSSQQLAQFQLRRVFLLATVGPTEGQQAIVHENKRFGDLVQGNFREAYRNLTYKHVMGLDWAATYCAHAKYVLKMDDDIVFDMHKVRALLGRLQLPQADPLAGYILQGMAPIRQPANKWFVTRREYAASTYPPFVSGWFYITTPQVAGKLVAAARSTPYFWIDDVYVTGVLAARLGIQHVRLNGMFAVHAEYLECCIRDVRAHSYDCDFLVGPNGGDNNMFVRFNAVMLQCFRQKCEPRPRHHTINNTCIGERKTRLGKGRAIVNALQLV